MERNRTEAALRESEERYALAALGANDGLWDWDLRSNTIYLSPRWKAIIGFGEDDLGNRPEEWLRRVHPNDVIRLRAELDLHFKSATPHFEIEHRIRHKDGGYRWVLSRGVAVRDETGTTYRVAGSLTDVTQRKAAEEQLLHDALHDSLTGLPNRALFLDRLGVALAQAKRQRYRSSEPGFCVFFLDLDRFKNVNDSLGHAHGDDLLLAMARRLAAMVRPGDTVARLGGDEFTILMSLSSIDDANRVAERVQRELAIPFDLEGHEVFTAASIGIAMGPGDYQRAEDLLRDADTAMYRAKSRGRGRHAVFDPGMHEKAVTILKLEGDLRRALERDELALHYQPIVSLESSQIVGFEALLRWRHPERGLVYPTDIIPLAEETNLILPIGEWAMQHACAQLRAWQDGHPERRISVSINLSGKQFLQKHLVDQVGKTLRDSGIRPGTLSLELTESVIMDNADSAIARLMGLRELDVKLDVDDFGTGYSSLSYLHKLPIDTLKIDRSFVNKLDKGPESVEIINLIVTLARNLGLSVSAEGLETREQVDQVRRMACELGQGFFFARAVDADAAGALLGRGANWHEAALRSA